MQLKFLYHQRLFLILALIIAGIGFIAAPFAKFSYDFEKFFPENNELTNQFNQHRERFGSDNDFLLIALPIQSANEIKKAQDAYLAFKKLENVDEINGVFNYRLIKKDPFSNVPFELDLVENHEIKWELFKEQNFDFDYLFSKDSAFTLLRIEHTQFLSNKKSRRLYESIKKIIKDKHLENAKIVGRIAGQIHYLDVMQNEMMFFVAISLLLIVLFIWLIYRSWKLVGVTLIIVVVSITVTIGIVVLGGEDLNLLLSIVPSIIFIVAISDVVHYLSTLQITDAALNLVERQKLTFKKVGVPTGLTSLTTAIGFITLSVSDIQPLRVFGLYTGVGIVLTYIFTFAFLPVLISKWKAVPLLRESNNQKIMTLLSVIFDILMKRKALILLIFSIVLLGGIVAFKAVQTNNYLLEDLSEHDPVRMDFQFLDENMGGSRPIEIAVYSQDLDLKLLEQVKNKAQQIFEINNGFDVLALLKRAHFYRYGTYQLPQTSKRKEKLLNYIKKEDELWNSYYDDGWYRFKGLIADKGGQDYLKKEGQFNAQMSSLLPQEQYYVTGAASLIDHNNELLSGSIIKGLILAFIIIALIVAYFFKSLKMILIALVVNIMPLFMVLTMMYFMNIDIKISTSIIFSIIFGIAVDDTIHFLMRFRADRLLDISLEEQLKKTYLHSARLLTITTFIILSGFIMLLASNFTATFYVGVFVSAGLFLALISDLTLLPVLIRLLFRNKR